MNISKVVYNPMKKRFEDMLIAGNFPKVEYKQGDVFKTYNMFTYSETWAKFSRVVDNKVKSLDPMGIWTRKRSKAFVAELDNILNSVTPEEVDNCQNRFKVQWMD